MDIKCIDINNNGYICCQSCFYTAENVLQPGKSYHLVNGINYLKGEIDSGIWSVSYMLSMYDYCVDDFVLFQSPCLTVNDNSILTLSEVSNYSCYFDFLHPLFSDNETIKEKVEKGLKNSTQYSSKDIADIFQIDSERFERPLNCVGNEVFKGMAAIGFCNNKDIYCFPWLSKMRFNSYHNNITYVLDVLERMNKMVIVPIGV